MMTFLVFRASAVDRAQAAVLPAQISTEDPSSSAFDLVGLHQVAR